MNEDVKWALKWMSLVVGSFLLLCGAWMAGHPTYNVYAQRLSGEAELAKAEYSKRVAVQEALAKREAAQALAEAEIIRAEGIAKANAIIGDSLRGNDAYLRYLWIQTLEHGENDVIYVPTEANLPILEATRQDQRKEQTGK